MKFFITWIQFNKGSFHHQVYKWIDFRRRRSWQPVVKRSRSPLSSSLGKCAKVMDDTNISMEQDSMEHIWGRYGHIVEDPQPRERDKAKEKNASWHTARAALAPGDVTAPLTAPKYPLSQPVWPSPSSSAPGEDQSISLEYAIDWNLFNV